jgi:hypothetical protein
LISGEILKKMQQKAGFDDIKMAKAAHLTSVNTYVSWCKDIGKPSVSQFLAMFCACTGKCNRS